MERQAESRLPTQWGEFRVVAYGESDAYSPHLALISGELAHLPTPLVRIHSECMTGDVFGSLRCDCGEQLAVSMNMIGEKGGIIIYLRQEGRGIGLIEKLKAYNLQDEGMDTADANLHLGHEVDGRSFEIAVEILEDLDVHQINLLTNNPEKIDAIAKSSIELVKVAPLIIPAQKENYQYLLTKQSRMGHMLHLNSHNHFLD